MIRCHHLCCVCSLTWQAPQPAPSHFLLLLSNSLLLGGKVGPQVAYMHTQHLSQNPQLTKATQTGVHACTHPHTHTRMHPPTHGWPLPALLQQHSRGGQRHLRMHAHGTKRNTTFASHRATPHTTTPLHGSHGQV